MFLCEPPKSAKPVINGGNNPKEDKNYSKNSDKHEHLRQEC